MKDLTTYGEFLPLENSKNNKFVLHPNAQPKNQGDGGLYLHDHKGEVISAIREIVSKITGAAVKGQVADVFKIPTPAYVDYCSGHWSIVPFRRQHRLRSRRNRRRHGRGGVAQRV